MMAGVMTVPLRAGAGMRLLRAAVFAAACVALSAAGHASASGCGIPPWALLAGWAAVVAVAAPLAGRERSLRGIAAAMIGGQVALHVLFSAGQWCAAPSAAHDSAAAGRAQQALSLAGRLLCNEHLLRLTPAGAEGVIRLAGIDPGSGATAFAPAGHAMSGSSGPMGYTAPMLCGHLAAALVAGWLLRRGEAALWRLVRLSAHGAASLANSSAWRVALSAVRVLALVGGVLAERLRAPRAWARGAGERARRPKSAVLQHSVIRRGPPGSAFAV